MRKPIRFVIALLVLVVTAGASWQVGHSQTEAQEYFPSKHYVSGAFLAHYRSIPNPELIYGYPITEAFTDRDGLRVQYFQRARFELQPGAGVVLTPIGSALYAPGRPGSDFNPSAGACRSFENGFRVCTAFLDFYDAHGGQAQFGLPISGVEQDGIRQVQYFEYARLEWHPEDETPGLDVQIGQLGRIYFDARGEDPGRLQGIRVSGITEVTALQMHAFSAAATIRGAGSQPVFVIVQDQTHAPVAGFEVLLTITYPDGRSEYFPAVTNELGFIELAVDVDPADTGAGQVFVSATAGFSNSERTAQTSFWSGR